MYLNNNKKINLKQFNFSIIRFVIWNEHGLLSSIGNLGSTGWEAKSSTAQQNLSLVLGSNTTVVVDVSVCTFKAKSVSR